MKKVFMGLIVLVLGLCLPIFTFAEVTEENPLLPDFLMPGVVEGTGTHFKITNSEYLNIVLDSSEAITLRLESVPEMVTMHMEPASEATLTQITIGGFQPSTTYYKYEDDYHNKEIFTTDENGRYTWVQDLSQLHLIFIQPRASTKFIKDDATGGDCYLIGNWDWATKTCTLTTDVYETIQIDSNYITLDGNGHTVTGPGTYYGVYLPTKTGVTIKNLNVENINYGIYLMYSSNNILTDNTASNNSYGIYLAYSSNNTLNNNITQKNRIYDLYVIATLDSHCNNIIQNTTGSGGRPIKYFNSSINLQDEVLSQLILCNADYSNINNVRIDGSETLKNNGLLVIRTDYSAITKTTSSNNYYGISLDYSSNNTLTGSTASNNYSGIYLWSSSNNTLIGNIASNNYLGIGLYSSINNTLIDNITQENSAYDLYVYADLDSQCNHVIQNTTGSGGRPIKFFNSAVNLNGEILSELILCNADYSNINNVTIEGSETLRNNGLFVIRTDYSNIANTTSLDNNSGIFLWWSNSNILADNTALNNQRGIYLWSSSNNTLRGNTVSNNYYGIYLENSRNNTLTDNAASNNDSGILLWGSNSNILADNAALDNQRGIYLRNSYLNTLTGNTASNNYYSGIHLSYCGFNTIRGNTVSNNYYGIYLSYDGRNQIYNNNFINNWTQAYVYGSSENIFNLLKPIGGNYWSDFDTPAKGCSDTNNDGFCDSPYYFAGGVDYLPWIRQSGWEVPADTIPPTTTITLSGTLSNDDWYVSNVQVTLIAADNAGGSGVKKTEYSFNGTTWNTYSTPFAISKEGTTTVYYRSTDNAGNIEATKSISVKIDKTLPIITMVTATPNTLWPPNHKMVDVKIDGSAADDISGIASVNITVTDEYGIYNMTVPGFGSTIQLESWREGTDRDRRTYTITVVATDGAGNQTTAMTQVIVPHDMGK